MKRDPADRYVERFFERKASNYKPKRKPLWTLDQALSFYNDLLGITLQVGYHAGLTGSVLIDGQSSNDLDVILYPMSTEKQDIGVLKNQLEIWRMKMLHPADVVHRRWRMLGSQCEKHVEVWQSPAQHGSKRVDLFFLR